MVVHALTLSYLGTHYHGWQLQPRRPTVQGVVEEALASELEYPVRITGASRTDAGVHARGQVATFSAPTHLPLGRLVFGVNRRLPQDVRILAASHPTAGFHPRFDALAKEYRYQIERSAVLSPLDADRVVALAPEVPFDLGALEAATDLLVGEHDFGAFVLVGGAHSHTIRRILDAHWEVEGRRLTLVLRGEGFLRGMVRSLVGTLLEVAGRRRGVEGFGALLEGGERSAAGRTAPPHGLCLEAIEFEPGRLEGCLPSTDACATVAPP